MELVALPPSRGRNLRSQSLIQAKKERGETMGKGGDNGEGGGEKDGEREREMMGEGHNFSEQIKKNLKEAALVTK